MARATLLLSCLALLAAAGARASSPTPLPAFELASLEGDTVPSAAVVREGRWLLVYVSPNSGASRSVLQALEGTAPGSGPTLLIVVGAQPAEAQSLAAALEGHLQATWLADPAGSARRALGLGGVPAVLGLNNGSIQWTLSGGVAERRTLRSILVSWR